MNLIKKQNFLLIAYTAKCIDVGKVCQVFFYRYYMSSFTENLYLKRQIQKLQEENYQLKYALQEIAKPPRPSRLRVKPSNTTSPKPKVPGEFGHGYGPGPGSFGYGYGQPALKPGQTLPGSGSGPSGSEGY
jgi:hypothetical protein